MTFPGVMGLLILQASAAVADEAIVPVYGEPRHRLMFEDARIRVLDLEIPVGEMTLFHRHDQPVLYITLSDTETRAQRRGSRWGSPIPGRTRTGAVDTNESYARNPVVHRVENIGDAPLHLIMVLNERRDSVAVNAGILSGMPGVVELGSSFFAQSRLSLEPGESLDWHGVTARIVFTLASDGLVLIRNKTQPGMTRGMHEPGDFHVIDSDGGLLFENKSDRVATIVAVAPL